MSQPTGNRSSSIQDKKQLQQLQFKVVWVSGQDPDHPKDELDHHSPDTRGWQSQKHCHYPQQIILKLPTSELVVELSKIQLLSHQSKIASKVEILVADDLDENSLALSSSNAERQHSITFDQCRNIRRLGYVSLDSNERSQCQARELKSINISPQRAMFVKFILHDCWKNDLNPFNQVGIISIQLLGNHAVEKILVAADNTITASKPTHTTITSLHRNPHENTPVRIRTRPTNHSSSFKLHPDLQARIDAVEQTKKDRAEMEDFDGASKLKEMLKEMSSSFASALQIECKMRKAAQDEEYAEASGLKLQRDLARKSAMDVLEEAEVSINNAVNIVQETVEHPFAVPCQNEPQCIDDHIHTPHQTGPPSHTIASAYHSDPPSPIATSASFPIARASPDRSDVSHAYLETSNTMHLDGAKKFPNHTEEDPIAAGSDFERAQNELFESGSSHPLEGVAGFQDLPLPEDIVDTRIASEVLSRIESALGLYRTKCLFSRSWNLRDAVLTKLSLMLPCIDIEGSAIALCMILERAINDCVVQVFLTGLIVLDECLSEFEKLRLPSKTVISMVEKIATTLVGKLCDNKPKVSDGAATTLLSFALSPCIGPLYIGNHALKNMRPQDAKAGRAVYARLKFLEKLIEEFGDGAVRTDKVVHFIKTADGFSHKDADVRTATKDLTTAMYKLVGEDVLFMLDGLSAKQLQECKASFVAVRQYNPSAFGDPRGSSSISISSSPSPLEMNRARAFGDPRGSSSNSISSSHSPLEMNRARAGTSQGKMQGRGRGRRRPDAAYHKIPFPENSAVGSFEKDESDRGVRHHNDPFGDDEFGIDHGDTSSHGSIKNDDPNERREESENSYTGQSSVSSFHSQSANST